MSGVNDRANTIRGWLRSLGIHDRNGSRTRGRPGPFQWHLARLSRQRPRREWAVKALWFANPGFDEAVTISGKRVDRTGPPPRFEQGSERVEQLEIPAGWSANVDHDHHTYPSAVVVSEPGCYELTISSTAFTTTIVMQVELADE
jgi:hypothetical protein